MVGGGLVVDVVVVGGELLPRTGSVCRPRSEEARSRRRRSEDERLRGGAASAVRLKGGEGAGGKVGCVFGGEEGGGSWCAVVVTAVMVGVVEDEVEDLADVDRRKKREERPSPKRAMVVVLKLSASCTPLRSQCFGVIQSSSQ